jgi:hypothetical protein
MPDSENPQPPSRVEDTRTVHQPTEMDEDEYHMRADEYMNAIHERAEEIQEDREDVEVEYSVSEVQSAQIGLRLLISYPGGSPLNNDATSRHVCDQQAATEQTNLALIAYVRTKAL